jgi:hypothetical protein
MVGDQPPITDHPDPVQVATDLDPAADHRRVDRIVVAVQPHVVVAWQPQRAAPPGHRGDWGQGQHRGPVGLDPVDWRTAQHPPLALVDHSEPVGQLGVEVRRGGEGPPGQERGLQIPIRPLDQPLGFWIGGIADEDLGAQHATEPVSLLGQHRGPPAALPDRALPVPHQHPRHPTKPLEELPPAGEQVLSHP